MKPLILALLVSCVVQAGSASLPRSTSDLLRKSLDRLRTAKAGPDEVGPEAPVRKALAPVEPSQLAWKDQLLMADWMLRAHILRTSAQAPRFAPGDADLEQAWRLVRMAHAGAYGVQVKRTGPLYRGSDARLRMEAAAALSDAIGTQKVEKAIALALDWISLQSALRSGDPERMALALEPYLQRKDMDAQELSLALMASAHTARWQDLRDLAQVLEQAPQLWAQLDRLAQEQPGFFNYRGIAALVKEADPQGTPLPGSATWNLAGMTLAFQEASSQDPDYAARAKQAFAQPVAVGAVDAPLRRVGAVALWRKPGTLPLALSGPATDQRMQLRASLVHTVQGTEVRRTESLDLRPDPAQPGRWRGTQTTVQQVVGGTPNPALDSTLVLQVTLDLAPATP